MATSKASKHQADPADRARLAPLTPEQIGAAATVGYDRARVFFATYARAMRKAGCGNAPVRDFVYMVHMHYW